MEMAVIDNDWHAWSVLWTNRPSDAVLQAQIRRGLTRPLSPAVTQRQGNPLWKPYAIVTQGAPFLCPSDAGLARNQASPIAAIRVMQYLNASDS